MAFSIVSIGFLSGCSFSAALEKPVGTVVKAVGGLWETLLSTLWETWRHLLSRPQPAFPLSSPFRSCCAALIAGTLQVNRNSCDLCILSTAEVKNYTAAHFIMPHEGQDLVCCSVFYSWDFVQCATYVFLI